MPSVIEQELVQASAFEPRRDYERQDYLAALARAINEVAEEDFDALSVEAQDWFNDAVRALNKKQLLPEFPDGAFLEERGESDDELIDEAEDSIEEVEVGPEPEEKPAKAKKGAKKSKAKRPAHKVEPEEPPAKSRKVSPIGHRKGQPPEKLEHPEIVKLAPDTKYEDMNIVFDEFGIVKGTKNHAAIAMLAKGCRMSDVTESIGGTYYNVLRRLVTAGHLLEKESNGILRLTHKDNAPKPKKK